MVNKLRRSLMFGAAALPVTPYVFGAAGNQIPSENAKAGYGAWRVQNWPNSFDWSSNTVGSTAYPQVEGYLGAQSVNVGGTIGLYVNCQEATFTVQVLRLGWYGGSGSRLMYTSPTLTGVKQTIPTAGALGLIDCNWSKSLDIPVPTSWPSGIYIVKMISGTSRVESLASFIVRDDARVADFILATTTNTNQAYNNWGGKSLYEFNSLNGAKSTQVSFNRPSTDNGGMGQHVNWELSMVRFMEREGYDIKYVCNTDVHSTPGILNKAKAMLAVGHDEYWSYEMKQAVQTAQNSGIHTAFLSSNTCYWQVRLSADSRGGANRLMLSYKEQALAQDPIADRKLVTTNWRTVPVSGDPVAIPENALMGVMYHGDPANVPLIADDVTNFMFAGTNIVRGTSIAGLVGYETDARFNNGFEPPNLKSLFASPDPYGTSSAVSFIKDSGAFVVGAGTMQWSWGVDYCPSWAPNSGVDRTNSAFQALNRNMLNRMLLPALKKPTNVAVTPSSGQNTLVWTAVSGAATYDVYRGTATSVPTTGTPYRTGLTATTITDTAITAGSRYFYVVIAKNGVAESVASAEASCIATGGTPALTPQTIAFTALAARSVNDGAFTLAASASSGLPITYTSSNPGVASINGNVVTPLVPGVTTITATQAGNSQYAAASPVNQQLQVNAGQSGGNILAPTGLTGYSCDTACWAYGSQGNKGACRINWTQSKTAGITGNVIYRGDGLTGVLVQVAVIPPDTTYIDFSVVKGQTYHWKVAAQTAAGIGPQSNDTSFTY